MRRIRTPEKAVNIKHALKESVVLLRVIVVIPIFKVSGLNISVSTQHPS